MKRKQLMIALGLVMTVPSAMASGFALIEQSASGQGVSYAGAAANAEDASVMWFNPAGLTQIEGSQAILGAHVIVPKTEFSGGGSKENAATNGFVPNLYWKGDYGDYAVGVGVNVPFGQKLEYDDDWVGRYQAVKTDLKSFNLNANIASALSNKVSVGFGINAQYVGLNMTQKKDVAIDVDAELDATSWGYGYNLGLMAQLTGQTQVGVSYRSEMVHHAKGDFEVNDTFMSNVSSDVTLPAMAMMSLNHQLSEAMTVLADVTWTGWKAYDELVIEYDDLGFESGTDQNFKDSLRYSLGMMYDLNDQWRLRTGVAFDETPVPDAQSRSPRTPDTDKTWISAGFNYQIKRDMSLDVGYSRLIGDQADIDYRGIVGEYDTSVDIFSAQLVWNY